MGYLKTIKHKRSGYKTAIEKKDNIIYYYIGTFFLMAIAFSILFLMVMLVAI
jgi:hypothetical protein